MLLLSAALVACGGDSRLIGNGSRSKEGSQANGSVMAPPSASLTQGIVTGSGSVIVNSIHQDVKNAQIDIDGTTPVEPDLSVSQQVRIWGSVDKDGFAVKRQSYWERLK